MSRRTQTHNPMSQNTTVSPTVVSTNFKKGPRKKQFKNSSSNGGGGLSASSSSTQLNNNFKNGGNKKPKPIQHGIYERLIAQAREAASSGDHVTAERFYQQADHHVRIMNEHKKNQSPAASSSSVKQVEKSQVKANNCADEEEKVKSSKFKKSRSTNQVRSEVIVESEDMK